MNKKQDNIKRVLNLLSEQGYLSTTQLGVNLWVTTVSAFLYVRELLEKGLIDRIGRGKNTRYGIRKYENKAIDYTILDDAVAILVESGFEWTQMTTREGVENMLLASFAFVSPHWLFLNGFDAFIAWCLDPKRGYTDTSSQVRELVYWLTRYYEFAVLRRKHGFFDGTASLQEVLRGIMEVFVDTLLFHDIVEISGFGKTKTAWELYLGKQNSDRVLLERAIQPSIGDIKKYIQNKKIDAVIFTPPTIVRTVQFRDVLRGMLKVTVFEVGVSKTVLPDRVLRAQKTLKWIERIINARENITLSEFSVLQKYNHIIILDDNFTTGATMNAIAEKLKKNGFTGKITAITITGKFHDAVISDDGEI